jgi:hypothetical protein
MILKKHPVQSTESRYPTPEINYSRSEQSHTQSNAPNNNHMGQQHSRSNREQQNTLRIRYWSQSCKYFSVVAHGYVGCFANHDVTVPMLWDKRVPLQYVN